MVLAQEGTLVNLDEQRAYFHAQKLCLNDLLWVTKTGQIYSKRKGSNDYQ